MTEQENQKKEFLRIDDMIQKLNMNSRKQFWLARRRGDIPAPIIDTPPTWREKDVDAFYDARAQQKMSKGTTEGTTSNL